VPNLDAPAPIPRAPSPWPRLFVALTVLAVVLAFLSAMLTATSGRFVPQVVDLYLVCQYAKALAEGHPFRYHAGEPASTGATSLLYTLWLGFWHTLGVRGEALVAAAITTGALLYAASVALAVRTGRRLLGEREGLLAGGLLALGGPVVWSFLYGSDIALFLFLCLLLFDRWLSAFDTGRFTGVAIAGSLLALARPEGLPLGLLLAVFAFLGASPASRSDRARALLPVLAAALPLTLQRVLTGRWLGSSLADKSLLANYSPADAAFLVSAYAVDVVRGLLLGFYPAESPIGFARGNAPFFFPPLALLFVLLALAAAVPPLRFPSRTFVASILLVGLLAGANTFMGVHHNRYLLWTFPILLVLTAVGLSRLTRLLAPADPRLERALFRAGALLFLVLGFLSTVHFAAAYGAAAGEIARRELPMAEWIRANLPADAIVANAATSVDYLTGRRGLNLHGVTSPAFFGGRAAEREAGLFEALSRLPEGERPTHLLSSASGQRGSPLLRELADSPPVFATLSLGDELQLFRLREGLAGRQARPRSLPSLAAVRGREEVDRLNVCDARDENEHGYAYESRLGELRLNGTVKIADYPAGEGDPGPLRLADSGRVILGGETFRVRTRGGRDLFVVLRTSATAEAIVMRATGSLGHGFEIPESRIEVLAGEKPAARASFRAGPGWSEVVLRIPQSVVLEGATDLELRGRYAAYHYWFYQ
jgi:hypothetical protein